MRWPQIVIIIYLTLVAGVGLIKDGETMNGKYSFLRSLFTAVFIAALLYAGGFWN